MMEDQILWHSTDQQWATVEERALHLYRILETGDARISDLMGPLSGKQDLNACFSIDNGDKTYFPIDSSSDVTPKDANNILLEQNVHPVDYVNPQSPEEYDMIAIGAGVSGLISIIIGAWLGRRCALIEKHAMGGDCLNTGCVPSKALISCAKAFHDLKNLKQFGISLPEGEATIDFGRVMERMREIRAKISHHDSVQRYARDFCDVYIGTAKFVTGNEIEVVGDDGSQRLLKFKKAMIATGASPFVPPELLPVPESPHSSDSPSLPREYTFLTSQTFFNLTELPPRLVVIGSGPIGLELAQSMARLGSRVTCLERGDKLMGKEDQDAVAILQKQLIEDGVEIVFNCKLESLQVLEKGSKYSSPWGLQALTVRVAGEVRVLLAESILNATGRVPNVFDLGLDEVGVSWDNRRGIHVNEYFQTTNKNIYSCGDCTGTPFKFTHSADFQARMAVRNMFLGPSHRSSDLLIPWCSYTDPEIAHVGKYEKELLENGIAHEVFMKPLKDVDRCMCEGVTDGFVKVIVRASTCEIVGATICGPRAGDMISEMTVCIQNGLKVQDLSGTIHPYPTTQEATRLACLGFNKYFKSKDGVPMRALRMRMDKIEKEEEK